MGKVKKEKKEEEVLLKIRVEMIGETFAKIDNILIDDINKNKYNFLEIDTILQLLNGKVQQSKVNAFVIQALSQMVIVGGAPPTVQTDQAMQGTAIKPKDGMYG